jgi:hypothetical protein
VYQKPCNGGAGPRPDVSGQGLWRRADFAGPQLASGGEWASVALL